MNIIVTLFIVLFVLGFIMLLVIANRLHDDYEEIEQTQEFIVDSLQEQRNTHTITVDDTEEKVEDVSTINFESK